MSTSMLPVKGDTWGLVRIGADKRTTSDSPSVASYWLRWNSGPTTCCVCACVCLCRGGRWDCYFLGVRGLVPFLSNRCGLFHTSSLREKWSSQLTWELCCSLRDQRCHQHHNHEHVPHLALHYSYGRGICTVEERHACRLHTMPTRSSLPGTDCNSFRTRVHYSSPSTNSPNHN